jgi:hypothetical protein
VEQPRNFQELLGSNNQETWCLFTLPLELFTMLSFDEIVERSQLHSINMTNNANTQLKATSALSDFRLKLPLESRHIVESIALQHRVRDVKAETLLICSSASLNKQRQ